MYSSTFKYFTAIIFLWSWTSAKICETPTGNVRFDCPRADEPYDFTECCMHENTTDVYCCENPLHERSNRLLIMISMTVILTCISLSVLVIVCCFWSKCPLFDLCWVNYQPGAVIAYTKEEEALNKPPDENEYSRQYTPLNVKVSRVDDV